MDPQDSTCQTILLLQAKLVAKKHPFKKKITDKSLFSRCYNFNYNYNLFCYPSLLFPSRIFEYTLSFDEQKL